MKYWVNASLLGAKNAIVGGVLTVGGSLVGVAAGVAAAVVGPALVGCGLVYTTHNAVKALAIPAVFGLVVAGVLSLLGAPMMGTAAICCGGIIAYNLARWAVKKLFSVEEEVDLLNWADSKINKKDESEA